MTLLDIETGSSGGGGLSAGWVAPERVTDAIRMHVFALADAYPADGVAIVIRRHSGLPRRLASLAAMARESSGLPILRPCRWGGCNGVGPDGGYCNRCGSPVA